MQPDSDERREFSRALLQALWGFGDLDDIKRQLRAVGLTLRQLKLPSGADRFIVLERNGHIYDSFTYYGEEALAQIGPERREA
jgi:hypothetical protein